MRDPAVLQGFSIRDKCAAVIGVGGLGCHIATHLALSGVGRLLLCDFDTVSETNLNRQLLYTAADIGRPKVFLAAARLREQAPDVQIEAFETQIRQPEDLAFCRGADAVFLAVDNNAAREAVCRYAEKTGKPLINGGVNGFYGTAYGYLPGRTATPWEAGLLLAENEKTYSVSPAVGVIGALEAQIGISVLLGDESLAGRLFLFDNGEIHSLPIKKKELNADGTV